ncbi:FecR/PupR family sigma factor regulator, partial [Rhizobiaceae sp. 2RAB30]
MERPHGAEKDRLRREAVAWVARVTSGDAGTDDAEELAVWRSLSPDHEEAYREAVTVWKAMGP